MPGASDGDRRISLRTMHPSTLREVLGILRMPE